MSERLGTGPVGHEQVEQAKFRTGTSLDVCIKRERRRRRFLIDLLPENSVRAVMKRMRVYECAFSSLNPCVYSIIFV